MMKAWLTLVRLHVHVHVDLGIESLIYPDRFYQDLHGHFFIICVWTDIYFMSCISSDTKFMLSAFPGLPLSVVRLLIAF